MALLPTQFLQHKPRSHLEHPLLSLLCPGHQSVSKPASDPPLALTVSGLTIPPDQHHLPNNCLSASPQTSRRSLKFSNERRSPREPGGCAGRAPRQPHPAAPPRVSCPWGSTTLFPYQGRVPIHITASERRTLHKSQVYSLCKTCNIVECS